MSIRNSNSIPVKPKVHTAIWIFCRVALLVWGIVEFLLGNTVQFLQSLFAIAFTHLWDMFQMWGGKSFITKVPYYLQTELNVFICVGCVVGTSLNLHTDFEYMDIVLHTFAGVLSQSFMFELIPLVNGKNRETGPAMQAMFSFTGAIAILVGWEIYEFTMDRLYGMFMQRSDLFSEIGLTDTMWDLINDTIGALCSMFVLAFSRNGKFKRRRKK